MNRAKIYANHGGIRVNSGRPIEIVAKNVPVQS
jgi:hypothetical protein